MPRGRLRMLRGGISSRDSPLAKRALNSYVIAARSSSMRTAHRVFVCVDVVDDRSQLVKLLLVRIAYEFC